MGEPSGTPSPPADLPTHVVETLDGLSAHDLREAMLYAQDLLRSREAPSAEITAGPGEEIVDVVERPGYVEVVKRQPCGAGCADCPHGPYVYHVTRERRPDGSTRRHWTLVGRRVATAPDAE
ncbi:MAG: hypothetical protein ABEJ82_05945 [Haloplanus sp.]